MTVKSKGGQIRTTPRKAAPSAPTRATATTPKNAKPGGCSANDSNCWRAATTTSSPSNRAVTQRNHSPP